MTTGTSHAITPELHLIEGHHPHSLWEDPDFPTIAVYRGVRRLYLLDTGAGPEQREAILRVTALLRDGVDEVVLLNSHAHLDHLGNNDLLSEVAGALPTRHYIPRDARPGLDSVASFSAMYRSGLPYFDYLTGLTLPPEVIAALLRRLGAPADLTGDQVADLGARMAALGLGPAVSGFIPSIVMDIVLQTYPPTFPSVETMSDYEDLAPAQEIVLGSTRWTGWTFLDDAGRPEVHVLQSGGHSAGGVVFHLPRAQFLMLADETSSVPIWSDSDPRRTEQTAHRALTMLDEGAVTALCAGHRPMLPLSGDQARTALRGVIDAGAAFEKAVRSVLKRFPEGLCIDELYDTLVDEAPADSIIAVLVGLQFPVFATFLKLTLLNHCKLYGYVEGLDATHRRTFALPPVA